MKPLTKTVMEVRLKGLYAFMVDCQKAEIVYAKEVGEESSKEYHFARSDVFGFVIEYCNVYFRPLV